MTITATITIRAQDSSPLTSQVRELSKALSLSMPDLSTDSAHREGSLACRAGEA